MHHHIKIGITHGDINGISYEVLVKALQDPQITDVCTPVIFGCETLLKATAEQMELPAIALHVIPTAAEAQDGHINLVALPGETPTVQYGQQTETALQAEAQALNAALEAYHNGHIQALVTLPGHLDNEGDSHALSNFVARALNAEDFHTDWQLCGPLRATELHPADVSTSLGQGLANEALHDDIVAIHHSLRADTGELRPRMAVVGQNEHLERLLRDLRIEDKVNVFGPFSAADFSDPDKALWSHYDACLYLDEAETQRKNLRDAERHHTATGYVSGLPLVLTYPLQGIGYKVAGRGVSEPQPLLNALYQAVDIVRHRQRYAIATRRPLEKYWVPRGRDDFKLDLSKEE